jgi:hypothetical protein
LFQEIYMPSFQHLLRCAPLVAAAFTFASPAPAQSVVLDDFEAPSLFIVQPLTNSVQKYLWNLYLGSGSTSLTTEDKHDGNQALKIAYTSGSEFQFQFYSYTEGLLGFGNDWQFMRRFVKNPSSYQTGRINRMRFWIKVPQGMTTNNGNHNIEFGTYARCSTCSGAEDRGGHFYHKLDIPYTGAWTQVIIDTHPDHERGANGDAEHPDQLHVSGESNFTYFDLLTRFYIHVPYQQPTRPGNFYLDSFELYQETNPENVDQVRAVHATYVPSSNTIRLGWMRKKTEENVNHEVRYSFSDIHASGWASATVAPNGTVNPPGDGGYNGMIWSTTGINLSGRDRVYIAIKPANSSGFRQIVVPITNAPATLTPSPPSNLTAG